MDLTPSRPLAGPILGAAVAGVLALPANALTITPYFDSSITSNADAAEVEGAIDTALNTIDSLYVNPGTVNIVFQQQDSTKFLGESNSADVADTYSDYVNELSADAAANLPNHNLATAIAHLPQGNDATGTGDIAGTTALFRVGLGNAAVTPCFDITGGFHMACGQTYDGVIVLTDNPGLPFFYSIPKSGSPSGYNAIATIEHETNEILGGGGQGSTLNAIQQGDTDFSGLYGPLDLYRYDAKGVPSFSTTDQNAYFSIDGGTTDIIGFNGNSGGDYADFNTNTNVQSAFSLPGIEPTYDTTSPEFTMMESIGYDGVPEPASLTLLVPALAVLRLVRRRRPPKHRR